MSLGNQEVLLQNEKMVHCSLKPTFGLPFMLPNLVYKYVIICCLTNEL
jgi:hypothetical protein